MKSLILPPLADEFDETAVNPWSGLALKEADETVRDLLAIHEGTAAADLSGQSIIRIHGPEALDYVDSLVTCTVHREPGTGFQGAMLSPKGKPLAFVQGVIISDSEVFLIADSFLRKTLLDHIDMYLVMRDCEIEDASARLSMIHVCSSADNLPAGLTEAAKAISKTFSHVPAMISGMNALLIRHSRYGAEGLDLLFEAVNNEDIKELLATASAEFIGFEAAEIARVETGMPRFGIELGPSRQWVETDLAHATDFEKGCYIGQESVAMAHFRGRPPRLLRGLILSGKPEAGIEPTVDGRSAGRLGTVAYSQRLDTWLALAFLRHDLVEAGKRIMLGAVEGHISELPFGEDSQIPSSRNVIGRSYAASRQ